MSPKTIAYSLDVRVVLARRVLPLATALALWGVVIESVRLAAAAF
ncbi:MAG TPA: hypothetical protein VN113_05695 [Caulobacter sp.]|nr:hypothetical protein [Caulobacter sp.]